MAYFERALGGACLSFAAYDDASRILELWFQDGSVYDYNNVDLSMYEKFDSEVSWGITFNTDMRPALTDYSKL